MKLPVAFLLFACCAAAEVRTMTFHEAVNMALDMNPDVVLARLESVKQRAEVVIAGDPFRPKIFVGSGAAYTNGFPMSIDGSAPSIVQAKTQMALFNRPHSYQVAETKEAARGAEIDVGIKQEEVAYRVATLFLDAAQISQRLSAAQQQTEILIRAKGLADTRVSEGRDLPIVSKRADMDVRRARKTADDLSADLIDAEVSLAQVLGMRAEDRVQPATEEKILPDLPASQETAIQSAIENSREIKRLESNLQARTLEAKSYRAERLPKVDLIAQYALLGKYNNFDQYFQRFQRNNFEFGASFSMPVLPDKAAAANAAQEEADMDKIRVEIRRTSDRIRTDLDKSYNDIRRAESGRDLARADLDLTREQLTIDLAQYDEGKLTMAQIEASRVVEQEKWTAYYESQHALEVARLNVLRQSGTLLAAVK